MIVLVQLVVSLGMLVIVSLRLTLMNLPGTTTARRWWSRTRLGSDSKGYWPGDG